MPQLLSDNGRYLATQQGDGNFVVYAVKADGSLGDAVWNMWGHEGERSQPSSETPSPQVPATPDVPDTPATPEIPGTNVVIASSPTIVQRGAPRVIRVTDERDGECVPRMYAYWSNAWVSGGVVQVFVGHVDGRPRFFSVELATGSVTRLGPLLTYTGTSEGWSWDASGWIHLLDGPRLRRVNPFSGEDRIVFDISETQPGCVLWQSHTSDDGQTHSATVMARAQEGAWPKIGTVVCRHGEQTFFPARGVLDESQVTPEGDYLIIKEDDDNRIVTLATGEERRLRDAERAVGHSDCGPRCVVGEADKPDPGACVIWDLPSMTMRRLFDTINMGYVSVRGGRCLHSSATHLSLVGLDGSGLTPLVAHGNVGSSYDDRVKANLDPTGRVACYMSNNGGGRRDVFVMEI